jgi:hypothetical protein
MNWKLLAGLVAVLGFAPMAEAAEIRLYGGVHYWLGPDDVIFDGGFAVGAPLADTIDLGFRGGVFINTEANGLGIPLDVYLHIDVRRTPLYFELMAGPWISLSGGDVLRTHAGGGFGLKFGAVSLGLEAAYLQPAGLLGARLAVNF